METYYFVWSPFILYGDHSDWTINFNLIYTIETKHLTSLIYIHISHSFIINYYYFFWYKILFWIIFILYVYFIFFDKILIYKLGWMRNVVHVPLSLKLRKMILKTICICSNGWYLPYVWRDREINIRIHYAR